MSPVAVLGAFVMTLSFLAYGIGSITLERFKIVSSVVLIFFSVGLLFEISAIVMMSLGSSGLVRSISGLHSIIGSFALFMMLVNTVWVWSAYVNEGIDAKASSLLVSYTKVAYFIWVAAYLFGIIVLIWI